MTRSDRDRKLKYLIFKILKKYGLWALARLIIVHRLITACEYAD